MHTVRTHAFVIPIVREIPPSWMPALVERPTQRDRVLASLLARP
jgi:hypothetical protein